MATASRTTERLRHHFEVERELAERLRASTRDERRTLYATLYDELFARVPDHPRLTVQETPESLHRGVQERLRLLRGQFAGVQRFLEIAPGDCRLAFAVCEHVPEVCGADISDQVRGADDRPANFQMIIYDGYDLPVADASIDLVFSYQFIEHLHPDDVDLHFETILRVLKPGGRYIFATPHRYTGPHDISAYFSTTPQGFHLKEWDYRQMHALLHRIGFSQARIYSRGRPLQSPAVNGLVRAVESALGLLPYALRKSLSRRQFDNVIMLAVK
jgi:SAM-dependent methyltransferase